MKGQFDFVVYLNLSSWLLTKNKKHYKMEKNPFSLFDFLGYFIPGSFALFLIYFLQNENGLEFYFKRTNIETLKTDMSILFMTFFIILAYTLGHILSFLSTLTIENFTIWKFGYPSKNLLNIPNSERYFEKKLKTSNATNWPVTILSFTLRFLLAAFLAPITLLSITIGKLLDLNRSVYTKKISDPYIDLIKNKIVKHFRALDPSLNLDFTKHDYNRLLIHLSYNINTSHQPKLMNYVALYGFLRVISFIFNVITLYLFLDIINLIWKHKLIIDFKSNLSTEFITLIICASMTYISYLGYLKFYRRYSQENLMILLLQ